jgi:DNA-binding NtrC family response regulator
MKRILVVDDNAELRSIIADVLRIEGYEVREAVDGIDAMDVFARSNPDAVLLDIQMPRQGGLETLKAIRGYALNMPVIILSGVDDITTVSEAMRSGAFDYISKYPLDFERVLSSLRQVLGRRMTGARHPKTHG